MNSNYISTAQGVQSVARMTLARMSVLGVALTIAACDASAKGPDPELARLPVSQLLQKLATSHDLDGKRITLEGYLSPEQVDVVFFKVADSTVIAPLFSEPGGRGRKMVSVQAKVRLKSDGENRSFELRDDQGANLTSADRVQVVGSVHYFNKKPRTPPPSLDQLSPEQKQNPAMREAIATMWKDYEQQKARGELLDFSYILEDAKVSRTGP